MRTNLQIKVGKYTGTGLAHAITGIGFTPDLVIVKGGANDTVFRTWRMAPGNTEYLSRASSTITTGITQLISDGFLVSTGATVNTNGTEYYYIAIRGAAAQNYFRTGRYQGNGVDDRNFITGGLYFTPDIVFIKAKSTRGGYFRTVDMVGDAAARIDNAYAILTGQIQALITNGFQLGNNTDVNGSGVIYNFFALKSYSGIIKTFKYTGDGNDNRSITGIGFQPDFILVKGNEALDSMIRISSMSGDTSGFSRNTAFEANHIQAILADGFQVGASDNVNKSGVDYYGFALREGNFNVPIIRNAI